MASLRKRWEQMTGESLLGFELHHIIPRHNGGGDNFENLQKLTKEEHQQIHLDLYEKTGNFRDLCAYYLLTGRYSEAQLLACSNGGKIGGKKVKETEVGIFDKKYDRNEWAVLGGKESARVQIENKIGIHGQTEEERKNFGRMGCKKLYETGKAAFQNPEIQRELGRRGGPKNKGFVWLTDGEINIKYSPKKQKEKSVDDFLKENPSFYRGNIITRNQNKTLLQCPKCGKEGTMLNMYRDHFDNCGIKRTFKMKTSICPHCGKEGAGTRNETIPF